MGFGQRSVSKTNNETAGDEGRHPGVRGRDANPASERFVREFVVQRPSGRANPYDDGQPPVGSGILKSFWAQAALVALVFALVCYGRAFQVCSDLNRSGKFYSTMTLNRCIRIAVKSPHHTFAEHQKAIEDES